MITKKTFSLCILITILIFSCNNDDSEPAMEQGGFNNISELETKLDSVYINLARATKDNTFFASAWAGDDITTFVASGKADFREIDARLRTNTNNRHRRALSASYKIIKDINTILFNAANFNTENNGIKDQLLGEAYFIRGFLYHYLIRRFGKLPIQLNEKIAIDAPIAEPTEVYQLIENDWLKAEQLLPVIYPGIEAGAKRPNKGSAAAFLARLYLDWAGFPVKDNTKYELAAAAAKKVIDNNTAHGFDLIDNLDDLWTLEHRFNKESIFTIEYCTSCPQGGNRKYGRLGYHAQFRGWNETFAEIKFFENFPDNHRKNATYITDIMIEDPFTNPTNRETIHWENQIYPQPIFAKITGKGDIPRGDFVTNRNDYIMRYAEVLLIYAEASARAGNSSADAWEALNKVRRRAELLPFQQPNPEIDLTTGNLAELAYTEKGWELAGEFLRWYDLIRMEKVSFFLNNDYRNSTTSKISDPNNPNNGQTIEEPVQILGSTETDNYFYPIFENDDYKEFYPKEDD